VFLSLAMFCFTL